MYYSLSRPFIVCVIVFSGTTCKYFQIIFLFNSRPFGLYVRTIWNVTVSLHYPE